jgi:hypothetical protein
MDPRAAELAANQLHRARQFALHSLLLAAVSVALTPLAWLQIRSAFVPLVVLSGAESLVAMCAYYWRLDLLQNLALDPATRDIPEVARYCRRLAFESERRRLAGCINSIIREAAIPGSFVLRERIALVEDQLRVMANQLASPEVTVHSRSLVMCVRLLSRGVESPLFNAKLPVEDLYAALHRIRHGIGRPVAAGSV